jgi:hypothetical protein
MGQPHKLDALDGHGPISGIFLDALDGHDLTRTLEDTQVRFMTRSYDSLTLNPMTSLLTDG